MNIQKIQTQQNFGMAQPIGNAADTVKSCLTSLAEKQRYEDVESIGNSLESMKGILPNWHVDYRGYQNHLALVHGRMTSPIPGVPEYVTEDNIVKTYSDVAKYLKDLSTNKENERLWKTLNAYEKAYNLAGDTFYHE